MADFSEIRNTVNLIPDSTIDIIVQELARFNWKKTFNENEIFNLNHYALFAQEFSSDSGNGKSYNILIFSNYRGNYCNACRGNVSFFEFQKKNKNWIMVLKHIAFTTGNCGGIQPERVKLLRIGKNNRFAFEIETTYSGMNGHEILSSIVFTLMNGKLKNVFSYTNYEYYFDPPNDFNPDGEYKSMRVKNNGKDFYDLETTNANSWDSISDEDITGYYFNGVEYVENN